VVLAVLELTLIGVRGGFEGAVTVELAVEELALELVTVVEDDYSLPVLEVVVELPLVYVLSQLLQLALPLEAMITKLALVHLPPVGRHVLPRQQLAVLKNSRVARSVLLIRALTTRPVVFPSTFVGAALRPVHASLSVADCPNCFPHIDLSRLILDAEPVAGQLLDLWSLSAGLFAGNVDGDWRAA
jgi:hypothetical protein